ncbi:MAG: nicotinate-nucleotide adenylyltransferase [Gammaproteobacteria bacterium]|nr:nicotinate-nucleotide adenylyltransferase [Gammaproteobacteria bacterium]
MLVGLYGGTFDPVHIGHTHAAYAVANFLKLGRVRMVLAARPGHRGVPGVSLAHRWQMLKLACEDSNLLVADDCEMRREGESYTFQTVVDVRRKNPEAIPCWILGQDAFATLPEWYRWQELLQHCNLIVVRRPGDVVANESSEPGEVMRLCCAHEVKSLEADKIGQILRLNLPMKELSATQIRRRAAERRPLQHLLAESVCNYIDEHKLYVG